MCWVWNRCNDPESHMLQRGNFFERQGSTMGWSEWNSVNLVYMAILSLVNTIKQGQISQHNDSSYTNTKILHPSSSLTSYTLQLKKLHCQMHRQTRWSSLYAQSYPKTTLVYNRYQPWNYCCDYPHPCRTLYVTVTADSVIMWNNSLSLSCKNPTCIKMTPNGKLLKLMLHSLVWIKSMSWFLITTYLHFRYDVPK